MSNFRPIDRDTGFLLPPSVDEWLPERHLARFVVEVIGGLDLSVMHKRCPSASRAPPRDENGATSDGRFWLTLELADA
jgi:hypothetical protein